MRTSQGRLYRSGVGGSKPGRRKGSLAQWRHCNNGQVKTKDGDELFARLTFEVRPQPKLRISYSGRVIPASRMTAPPWLRSLSEKDHQGLIPAAPLRCTGNDLKMTASTALKAKRPTFRGIQALRGFAACMVVVHHATQQWSLYTVGDGAQLFWANGAAGVDIFFVISGFVMAVSTIGREHKTHPARSFLERRLIRLVPLYWIVTFIVLFKLEMLRKFPGYANGPRLGKLCAGA
jgi:hypothetical protein